ncbi:60S ribosomal protein L23a [Galemys pyrenaicus]|uniref:60S ribosomal protein L23a n=1 Tax=Galemys pyrenaicus TaxID=202257 RepID=A0A8J6DRZ5_GALPY|nr:60S ribosomal protein L23a [Galemys pyrenaicus]
MSRRKTLLPKAQPKAKAFKAKKEVLKGIHSCKKKSSSFLHTSVKKTTDNNTLGFMVVAKVTKHQIRQPVKNLYGTDMVKVSTLIRPNGVCLTGS